MNAWVEHDCTGAQADLGDRVVCAPAASPDGRFVSVQVLEYEGCQTGAWVHPNVSPGSGCDVPTVSVPTFWGGPVVNAWANHDCVGAQVSLGEWVKCQFVHPTSGRPYTIQFMDDVGCKTGVWVHP